MSTAMPADTLDRAVEAMWSAAACPECLATWGERTAIYSASRSHPRASPCHACARLCLLAALRVVLAEPSEAAVDALDTMRYAKILTASDDRCVDALRTAFAATLAEMERP